jgi:hypothetical protein
MTFDEAKRLANGNTNTYFIFSERRDTKKALTTFAAMVTLVENGIYPPEKVELTTNSGRIIFLKGASLEKGWEDEFSKMNVDVFKEEPKIIF